MTTDHTELAIEQAQLDKLSIWTTRPILIRDQELPDIIPILDRLQYLLRCVDATDRRLLGFDISDLDIVKNVWLQSPDLIVPQVVFRLVCAANALQMRLSFRTRTPQAQKTIERVWPRTVYRWCTSDVARRVAKRS